MTVRDAGIVFAFVVVLASFWLGAQSWRALPDAPQLVYRDGVPHTTRNGIPRQDYDPEESFLPVGLYHALAGEFFGRTYGLDAISEAGFNTVHFWERQNLKTVADAAADARLQVVFHYPDVEAVRRFRDHPALLSWYLDEEPLLRFPASRQEALRAAFVEQRDAIRRLDPVRPIHIVSGPPRPDDEWQDWAHLGDLLAFSVYPVRSNGFTLEPVAASVSRAVASSGGRKPVWFVAQAFASPRHGRSLPAPDEYRAMIYAALVHGATGIISFAYDSFVTRDGQVLGIAPAPAVDYGDTPDFDNAGDAPLVVEEAALTASRTLWRAAGRINRELEVLAPALLSPTSIVPYRVSVRGAQSVATPLRTLLKYDTGGMLLIAVNLAGSAVEARFSFASQVTGLSRPFLPRTLPPSDARGWTDKFGPFEARVYRFGLSPDGTSKTSETGS